MNLAKNPVQPKYNFKHTKTTCPKCGARISLGRPLEQHLKKHERDFVVKLHRLVEPFKPSQTLCWRERQQIRTALANIACAAQEASLALEPNEFLEESLSEASEAMYELEASIKDLKKGTK